MAKCDIKPISAFQSTNLSSKINTFNDLGDRILNTLGYPFINIEIHRDSLYNNIQIAIEMFSKFAGYTQEYLMFDSALYQTNQGIRLDHLFTVNFSNLTSEYFTGTDSAPESKDFTTRLDNMGTNYVVMSAIPPTLFTKNAELSTTLASGLCANDVVTDNLYDKILEVELDADNAKIGSGIVGFTLEVGGSLRSVLSGFFIEQPVKGFSIMGTASAEYTQDSIVNSFDYDVMDYRKVIAVQDFEEGSTTGINTLFTIEQTLAQQTYFSYAMGNYGFDLISWYTLKDFLETREKLLATRRSYSFDDRTQMLRMYPQPGSRNDSERFYGVVSCQVERPIRDIIKEHWVYQYALALTKITVANVRGKYGNVSLFGGGSLNSADLMSQGLADKEKLETAIYEGAPGLGDAAPPLFFVG